ncbi:MAG: TetR/AcrR family transcriptional regulator [Alphaproteobacteria bacterium]|nr:TetR/AcrR family transcriptional regulator [Alphaproteobacteria bacterium]
MARIKGVSKNPERAQAKIVDSALREFGERGYAAASTQSIAERAGYSQATLFFHFKTKAGLLQACLEESRKRVWGSLADESVESVLDLVARLDDRFRDPVMAEFYLKLLLDSRSDDDTASVYASYHARVRRLLRDEIVRETGASKARAFEAAGTIHSLLVGIHAAHAIDPKLVSRAGYTKMLMRTTELLLADLRRQAKAV